MTNSSLPSSKDYASLRERVNQRLYGSQLLIDHMGTPNPSAASIYNWKTEWAEQTEYVCSLAEIKQSNIKLYAVLKELKINELVVHISHSHEKIYFLNESDFVMFKMFYA